MPNRIKDINLASDMPAGLLEWQQYTMPITNYYGNQIASRDYHDKRVVCWMHITFNVVPMLLALHASGAEVLVGACNADSTDDHAAAYLASQGIQVFGWRGMQEPERLDHLNLISEQDAHCLCDTGGELALAFANHQLVAGSLEATRSGILNLEGKSLPFPIFNWNDTQLKKQVESRINVGASLWQAFNAITNLSLFGRRVLVIGYGPVGKGIAERARNLGAVVYVTDRQPLNMVDARYHGCQPVSLEQGLAECQIIVTATGMEKVLSKAAFEQMQSGTLLINAGHFNTEIDVDWLSTHPRQKLKPYIERFTVEDKTLYLLANGNLLNLATAASTTNDDLFDHFTAMMLLGIDWILQGEAQNIPPGVHLYPQHLEQAIADVSVKLLQNRPLSPVS